MPPTSTGASFFSTSHTILRDWTTDRMPALTGTLAVVTGANGGIGLVTARELALAGATVILAVRDPARGDAAARTIDNAVPGARLRVRRLDLADLGSVRDFAAELTTEHDTLDLLVNNAGVMAVPRRLTTADGFELQLGTNHLGHFALTGLLLPALLNAPQPRVVTVSSTLHTLGRIDFDDLHGEDRYSRYGAYGRSKLANLLFTGELDRRATVAGSSLRAIAAHPGYASTNLQLTGQGAVTRAVMACSNALFAVSPRTGARPVLCAATLPDLPGGVFVGPRGLGGYRGSPGVTRPHHRARDQRDAARLWALSADATGVHYDFADRGAPAHGPAGSDRRLED
ncbi:oxidoreductase [Streptomyces sp. NPDC005827]|uniref:oxidoreductase n=1 Tax=Streptomyces sp. NPDC005827 TaxID=3157070 RepID=UPI0033CE38DD